MLIDIKILKKYFLENETPGATRRDFHVDVNNENWGYYNGSYHFGTRFETTHIPWVRAIIELLESHFTMALENMPIQNQINYQNNMPIQNLVPIQAPIQIPVQNQGNQGGLFAWITSFWY